MTIALVAFALVIFGTAVGVFNPLSGVTGFVKISTTPYAFTKWSVEMKCVVVRANNFTGGGYQQVVPGMISATLTLDADTYDEGNMAFTVGNFYTFVLGYTSSISLTLSVLVESISPEVNYEEGQPIKIVGQSDGEFSAEIT